MKAKLGEITFASTGLLVCFATTRPVISQESTHRPAETRHVLFVGDSFTHRRYVPVRTYDNTPGTGGLGSTSPSRHVVDENFDTDVPARMESASERSNFSELLGRL